MTLDLELVGHIDVPPAVLEHRFVREALACTRMFAQHRNDGDHTHQVVGTENTRRVELYGWTPHVDPHVDRTGHVYLLALNEGRSSVNVLIGDDIESLWLPAGAVVRLNDYQVHWTEDDSSRVCAFVGSYEAPQDAEAMTLLQSGVDALVRGDYYAAPRVGPGFRVPMDDECFVMNEPGDGVELMLIADAEARGRLIERCAHCDALAVRIDRHYPYHTDMNRCREHLHSNAGAKSGTF
jgi:hypothetical protein